MKYRIYLFVVFISLAGSTFSQSRARNTNIGTTAKVQYGTASYYADKFNGRRTANGETFSQKKMTAAHNTLPLGTWVKVTNLRNKKSVIVKINDRLHRKNPRLIDLSKLAAQRLAYTERGLTKVKVEVMGKTAPALAVK